MNRNEHANAEQIRHDGFESFENGLVAVCATVVVPCFNEGQGIEKLAKTLKAFSDNNRGKYRFQFILVDDGSEDDTWELMADHFSGWKDCVLLRHQENRGLMAAIITGTMAAAHEIVCSMDSDCTYHPDQFPALIEKLEPDVAMVTSSPYHPLGEVKNVQRWRITLSRFASFLYARMMRNKLYCYTSCFRVFRKSVVANIQLINTGFVGTAELVWRLEQLGDWKIVEVPSTLEVRQIGQSKCRVVRVTLGHLLFMASIIKARLVNKSGQSLMVRQQH